jgi:hypothetical protein
VSWLGTHPKLSREEARGLLPPGACKLCVYWRRVFVAEPRSGRCYRCGIVYGPMPTVRQRFARRLAERGV